MSGNKTVPTNNSVQEYLATISPHSRQEDARAVHELFRKITGDKGTMWGSSIVGYGKYQYTRSDKKTYEFLRTGFSSRKAALTLYIMPGYEFDSSLKELMEKLGKYKIGKSCLYIKKLEDIDLSILEKIIRKSLAYMADKYPQ